eukprot:2033960-Amphidinium_carterae.1
MWVTRHDSLVPSCIALRPPAYPLGTSERKQFKKDVIPGPGAHERKTSIGEFPHYSVSLPLSARGNDVPGPGSYELAQSIDSLHTTPVWSVGTSERKEFKRDMVPGPGAHESNTSVGEGPQYSHGLPLSARGSNVPGPGSYDLAQSMDSLHTPAAWTVGTSGRKEFKRDTVPGPGAHESNTVIGEGPQYSHGLPLPQRGSDVPGP